MQTSKINIIAFVVALTALTAIFTRMMYPFILNAVVAAVLAILVDPLNKRALAKFPRHKYKIALSITALILIIVVMPVTFALYSMASQAPELISWTADKVKHIETTAMTNPLFVKLQNLPQFHSALQMLSNAGSELTSLFMTAAQSTVMGASSLVFSFIFIMLFLFFFIVEGKLLLDKFKSIFPVGRAQEYYLFKRLESVIDATIRGNLIIAILEGAFGGLLLFIYGYPSPLLLAFIMAIFSFLPAAGTNFIIVPLGIMRIISGQVISGVSMICISLVVIFFSQNVLKPKLVGDRAGLHPFFVLITTIGGIAWLGPVGFIMGPIIAVLFLTSWELFAREFVKQQPEETK
ncbi:MAG: AI-2E family transporter [Fibrobacteres bacterium]|nr:AI-2E family transporter [Fibrobacterota bacterium]